MNDLDKLRELLFGAEKQALDSIKQRVERREDRAIDVADILPDAIHSSHKRSKDLVESLRKPVGECVRQEFHDDPQTYSDALYPVIGPAIRKSIMQALRTFSQQINAAVEQSLTPRGLKWRLQAARAGVPFGEFVLQKTLLYRVEQAYLISRENGLLIGHVHHDAAKIKDSDAVSAMFTAIQDFVKESFSPDRTGRLESADMGEFTLWAVHGPHALLVCVIRGVPPRSLRGQLSAILERVHFRYGDAIRAYTGDTASVADIEGELEKCLRFQALQKKDSERRRVSVPMMLLMMALVGLILYLGISRWMHSQALNRLIDTIQATPGIYLSESLREDNRIILRGLRDPLAPPISELATAAGIAPENVDAQMGAYQSLEPEIVATRVAGIFGNPPGVAFGVRDGYLVVTGPLTQELRDEIRTRAPLLAGVHAVRLEADGAEPEQAISERDLARDKLVADLDALDGRRFYFSSGTTLRTEDGDRLAAHARALQALSIAATSLGARLRIAVTGSADGSGDPAANRRLARDRATVAADVLSAAGIAPATIVIRAAPAPEDSAATDPELRRVTIAVDLVEAAVPE